MLIKESIRSSLLLSLIWQRPKVTLGPVRVSNLIRRLDSGIAIAVVAVVVVVFVDVVVVVVAFVDDDDSAPTTACSQATELMMPLDRRLGLRSVVVVVIVVVIVDIIVVVVVDVVVDVAAFLLFLLMLMRSIWLPGKNEEAQQKTRQNKSSSRPCAWMYL